MEELWGTTNGPSSTWFPAVDVVESEKELKFIADLPGLTEEDVQVELQDNVLSIRGKRETAKDEKTDDYVLCERSYGSFERRFTVDAKAQPDKIKAEFEKGILTVSVPKTQLAKPTKIAVSSR
jgi:HSP20 family protein